MGRKQTQMKVIMGRDPQRIIGNGAKYCPVIRVNKPRVTAKPLSKYKYTLNDGPMKRYNMC